jgi:hypothetical protein
MAAMTRQFGSTCDSGGIILSDGHRAPSAARDIYAQQTSTGTQLGFENPRGVVQTMRVALAARRMPEEAGKKMLALQAGHTSCHIRHQVNSREFKFLGLVVCDESIRGLR